MTAAAQGKHFLVVLPFFEMANNRWSRGNFENLYSDTSANEDNSFRNHIC